MPADIWHHGVKTARKEERRRRRALCKSVLPQWRGEERKKRYHFAEKETYGLARVSSMETLVIITSENVSALSICTSMTYIGASVCFLEDGMARYAGEWRKEEKRAKKVSS
jgi:hypothetical protein